MLQEQLFGIRDSETKQALLNQKKIFSPINK